MKKVYRNASTCGTDGTDVVRRNQFAFSEWMDSLEENPVHVIHDIGEDVNSINEHANNIEIPIFCDGAVDKASTKLDIGYIAYDRKGGILAKFLKLKNGDSPLLAEILAMKKHWT